MWTSGRLRSIRMWTTSDCAAFIRSFIHDRRVRPEGGVFMYGLEQKGAKVRSKTGKLH